MMTNTLNKCSICYKNLSIHKKPKSERIGNSYGRAFWISLSLILTILLSIFVLLGPMMTTSGNELSDRFDKGDTSPLLDEPIQLDATTTKYAVNEWSVENNEDLMEKGQTELGTLNTKAEIKASNDHPLTADEKKILKMDEIMAFNNVYGTNFGYDGSDYVINGTIQIPFSDRESEWVSYAPAKVKPSSYAKVLDVDCGDIDNDGLDEIVIISETIYWLHLVDWDEPAAYYDAFCPVLTTYDDAQHNFTLLEIKRFGKGTENMIMQLRTITNTAGWRYESPPENYFNTRPHACALALGDYKGGGCPNWLGLIFHRAGGDWNHNMIFIYKWNQDSSYWEQLDPWGHKYRRFEAPECMDDPSMNEHTDEILSADCVWADVNNDQWGRKEFIAVTNFKMMIWVGLYGCDVKVEDDYRFIEDYDNGASITRVVAGNFDGDANSEIAIFNREFVRIYDYDSYLGRMKVAKKISVGTLGFQNQIVTIDVNQDGIEEILITGRDSWKNWFWKTISYTFNPNDPYEISFDDDSVPFPIYCISRGDVNCDGWDEVVILTSNTMVYFDEIWVLEVGTDGSYNPAPIGKFTIFRGIRRLLCGAFNGIGMTLTYSGNYIRELSNPSILVAMAAPPTQIGISQMYGNSYTSYGQASSRMDSESSSIGFSVSSSIGLGLNLDLPYGYSAGLAASYTWGEEFQETGFTETTITVATYSSGGASDNTIIYFQVLFKRYIYMIRDHPFEQLRGTYMNISIPESPIVYSVSQTYYNQQYGSRSSNLPLIGDEIFGHAAGHPETYPQRDDVPHYSDLYLTPVEFERAVGQGEQYDSLEISRTDTVGSSFETTTSSAWAGEAQYAFINIGHERGSSEATGYTMSVSETCVFEGRVGQITDTMDYCLFRYRWGMYFYHTTHTGSRFLVINYYVEDATPYYPESETTSLPPSPVSSSFAPWYLIAATFIVVTAFRVKKKSK